MDVDTQLSSGKEGSEGSEGRKNKKLILAVGVVGFLLFFMVILVSMCSKEEIPPTVDELRVQHIDYLVKLLEAYNQMHGAYPQPTVRSEDLEGISHVWGYESDVPAIPSCNVSLVDDILNPETSHCGGDIYDTNGKLIGWKGTLTSDSGLNNIEVAHRGEGAVISSVSEINPALPVDPAFIEFAMADPASPLLAAGFGEYVYAVVAPEDGAQNKGGVAFQIAATVKDPETGEKKTHIRGDYFVRSDERDLLPASLIGSGLLFDEYKNPVSGQDKAIHILVDNQTEGSPNPILGDGEDTLKFLALKQRAKRLLESINDRSNIIAKLPSADSTTEFASALASSRSELDTFISSLESQDEVVPDVVALEVEVAKIASSVTFAAQSFIDKKDEEVSAALTTEVEKRDQASLIFESIFEDVRDTEDDVLLARDEVLKYLGGAGIEEQTRTRVGRKLQGALDALPNISVLFDEKNLVLPNVFLPEDLNEELDALAVRENVEAKTVDPVDAPVSMVSTIASGLYTHLDELNVLLSRMLDDIDNASVPIESVDESLSKLARALKVENERLGNLFDDMADVGVASELQTFYETTKEADGAISAMMQLAKKSSQEGNFSPLLLSEATFDSLVPEQNPGVTFEDEYIGIPYPLP